MEAVLLNGAAPTRGQRWVRVVMWAESIKKGYEKRGVAKGGGKRGVVRWGV